MAMLVSGRVCQLLQKCLLDGSLSIFKVHRIESLQDKVGLGSPKMIFALRFGSLIFVGFWFWAPQKRYEQGVEALRTYTTLPENIHK